MAQAQRYKLKLSKLQFCSLVDDPAQPNAKTLLIKRKGSDDDIAATARLKKVNDELGLAFFWAFTSTNADGSDHYDLQGDQVTEFIKAAMDYMTETGGAVDVMHDGIAGEDRVVFAMPMDPEIAAAYGMVTKQTGLMVVVKPTVENLAKLKSGELNGVSIGGLGQRIPVGKRAPEKVVKAALYTDEVDGHAHKICIYEDGSLYVEYATMGGAENQHSHGIVRGDDGSLTILADSGHSHALAEGQPSLVVVEPDAIVVVAASAKSGVSPTRSVLQVMRDNPQAVNAITNKSTRSTSTNEATSMANDTQIADLTKRLERAERIAKMTGAHKAHFDALSGDDAEAFLAKSAKERDAAIADAEKANEVVYTCKATGRVFRKSDDADKIDMAKQLDAQAEAIAKRDADIEKAAIRAQAADVLKGMPGDDDTHDFIIASLRKGGDPVKAEKALETLRGMRATSSIGKAAPGFSGGVEPTENPDAFEALKKGLETFCAEQKITKNVWSDGLDAFVKTEKGSALKKAHDASLAG